MAMVKRKLVDDNRATLIISTKKHKQDSTDQKLDLDAVPSYHFILAVVEINCVTIRYGQFALTN